MTGIASSLLGGRGALVGRHGAMKPSGRDMALNRSRGARRQHSDGLARRLGGPPISLKIVRYKA
jgi:hypothetical protein